MSSSCDGRGAQPRSDRKVECDWHPAAPARQVNVCRPARFRIVSSNAVLRQGALSWAWTEQSWFFVLRRKPGGRALVVDGVAQEVVSFRAVAAARAHEAVVPVAVHGAFAQRAGKIFLEDGCSEPSLHTGVEEEGLDVAVCPFRGDSVQPLAGSLYTGELKVGEVAWVVARSLLELVEAAGVDSCGQLSL